MPPKKTKFIPNAPTDDPKKLMNRAGRQMAEALQGRGDREGARMAAELAWLAVSSTADVLASSWGRVTPGGFKGRESVFKLIDKATGTDFANTFGLLSEDLHGKMFHDDDFNLDKEEAINYLLNVAKRFIEDALQHKA